MSWDFIFCLKKTVAWFIDTIFKENDDILWLKYVQNDIKKQKNVRP